MLKELWRVVEFRCAWLQSQCPFHFAIFPSRAGWKAEVRSMSMAEVIRGREDFEEVSTCVGVGTQEAFWGGEHALPERQDEDWNSSVQLRMKGNQPNPICSCDLTQLGQF